MRVIGMISGTSFDAVEAVAVEMSVERSVVHVRVVEHVSVPYAPAVRDQLVAMLPPRPTSIEAVCQLDTEVGQAFAEVAADLATRSWVEPVDVVCSHGQTVFHWVEDGRARGTLQIGQAAWIAERTGATVVADVRSRDVAAGGQGAPLASLLDVLLLGRAPDRVRGALNLGGISNVTVVGPGRTPTAYDIGPANALLDVAVEWRSEGRARYDAGGAGAAAGTVDDDLLADLLSDPYYAAAAPKSTGKEHFHLAYLRERLGSRDVATNDLLATLTALTAATVAQAVETEGVVELFVSGGGTRNPVLMEQIQRRLPGVAISLVDALGVPEAAKEAVLFAVIGGLTVLGRSATIPSCTGARHDVILGAITPGRQACAPVSDEPVATLVFEGVGS